MKVFRRLLLPARVILAVTVVASAVLISAPRASPQSPPNLRLESPSNGWVRLWITGDLGQVWTLQSVTNLGTPWEPVTMFTQTTSPFLIVDGASLAPGQRFYRAFQPTSFPGGDPTNMAWITPGTFIMGSPDSEAEREIDEGPQTLVTISEGFWIGRSEVTQGAYRAVTGTNPSHFPGDLRPVEQVTWPQATNFCHQLTDQDRAAGRIALDFVYRLPTEAEWEYACRKGSSDAFHYGPALRSGMANFFGPLEYDASVGTTFNMSGISLGQTTNVGSYLPNASELSDMHGNVWEWCQDWWSGSLAGGSVTNPLGPANGVTHVIRGGSWRSFAVDCRAAKRGADSPPDGEPGQVGFRVVLAPTGRPPRAH